MELTRDDSFRGDVCEGKSGSAGAHDGTEVLQHRDVRIRGCTQGSQVALHMHSSASFPCQCIVKLVHVVLQGLAADLSRRLQERLGNLRPIGQAVHEDVDRADGVLHILGTLHDCEALPGCC